MAPGRPLRVVVVADPLIPGNRADSQQIVKSAAALARAGADVELVVPVRSGQALWPAARRRQSIRDYYRLDEGLRIRTLLTWPAGEAMTLTKVLHGLAAPLALAFRERPDAVCTRSPLPALLSFALGQSVAFETYRAWGDERPALVRRLARAARHPRFLGLIQHSRYAAASLLRVGFPADRLTVLHNGIDPEDFLPVLGREEARREIGLATERPLAVYAGNLQRGKGIGIVLRMAARLPGVDFLFVGGAPADVELRRAEAAALGLRNATFAGHRTVEALRPYLYAADVLVIPPASGPLRRTGRTVLPIKTFSYLAAGRPILAPDLPDVGEILTDGVTARLVPPDRPDEAADALARLLADPARSAALAAAARELAGSLTWDARGRRLEAWLRERLDAARRRPATP